MKGNTDRLTPCEEFEQVETFGRRVVDIPKGEIFA